MAQEGYTRHGLSNKSKRLQIELNLKNARIKQLESFFDTKQLLELEISANGTQTALMPIKLEASFWKWECPLCGSHYVESEKVQNSICKVCNINFNMEA